VRLAGRSDGRPSGSATAFTPLFDPQPLHVSHLRQHGEDQFTGSTPNLPKATHLDRNSLVKKVPDGRLNIERVATEAINREDAHGVCLPNIGKQFSESGTIRRKHCAGHRLIDKLTVEATAKRAPLSLNRLVGSGGPIIGNAAHRAFPWIKTYSTILRQDQ